MVVMISAAEAWKLMAFYLLNWYVNRPFKNLLSVREVAAILGNEYFLNIFGRINHLSGKFMLKAVRNILYYEAPFP